MHTSKEIIWKNVGETPLEALERFRMEEVSRGRTELKDVPMTYAGRLDPMAEGKLLILIGEECRKKEAYLGLNKKYEVEIVFGVETDTYDALGLVKEGVSAADYVSVDILDKVTKILATFPKSYEQAYPPYSSKTYRGVQLHELARAGQLPDVELMPTRNVTLYSTRVLEKGNIPATRLKERILHKIGRVNGDFRQGEIEKSWERFFMHNSPEKLPFIRLSIHCSSGTYMRSLAHELGQMVETGAFALSIKRTEIIGI